MDRLGEHFKSADKLMAYYAEIDAMASGFMNRADLRCPPQCGKCCDTPSGNIEATLFEMLPLALELCRTGRTEEFHALATEAGDEGTCVLFNPELLTNYGGGCAMYDCRALVCRLFGAAAVRDKHGERTLSLCMLIEADRKDITKEALNAAPIMAECAAHARSLDPALSAERMGINRAIGLAIEKVILTAGLMGLNPRDSG